MREKKSIIRDQGGWTFMETLIVIAIVMVLSASVGFVAAGSLDKARKASAQVQMEAFGTALEAFYIDMGRYPTAEEGLSSLRKRPEGAGGWAGPYIFKDVPKDPWGHDYVYLCPGEGENPFCIKSLGADGQDGGDGKNEDVVF